MARKAGTGAGVAIRQGGTSDALAVAGLSGQLGYPASTADIERRLKEIEEDGSCALMVAELRDGGVVGWVLIHMYRLVTSDCLAQVAGLVVDENHRGQGVGALLMEAAEKWARERGCRGVILRSRVMRKEAHAFYRRLGYTNTKTQEVFLKELEH